MTKEFYFNFSENKDAILKIPDDVDLSAMDSIGVIGYGLQQAIINGTTTITERVWPCLYCGRKFLNQTKLIKHFEANHRDSDTKIKTFLEGLGTSEADQEQKS